MNSLLLVEHSLTPALLIKLLPGSDMTDEEQRLIATQYSSDLPSPELLTSELIRWNHISKGLKTTSVTSALDKCDADIFPNVNTLLRIVATLPVTTCECERSFSCLRRLNNYLRRTQSSQRLDALALINIHSQIRSIFLIYN